MTEQPAVSLSHDTDQVTLALHGEVDVLNVDEVRMAIQEALALRPACLVVDLADLSFIDSTGIGALIFGFQRTREQDVAFRLARPTPLVHQVLMISGLLEVVDLVEPPARA